MKTLIVSSRKDLVSQLIDAMRHTMEIEVVETYEKYIAFLDNYKYEQAIIDCLAFSSYYVWDYLSVLKEKQISKVFVIVNEEAMDSFYIELTNRLCIDFHFNLIFDYGVEQHICNNIIGGLNITTMDLVDEGKVITVSSTAPKDGATIIAMNTALSLAVQAPNLRVGLIDLNLKNPEMKHYFQVRNKDIKNNLVIRPRLQTNVLTPVELLDACIQMNKVNNLYVLLENNRRDSYLDFTPMMVHNLMNLCKKVFDITIADIGSYPDNAATIVGMKESDHRLLVTQNDELSFEYSWGDWSDVYWNELNINLDETTLILNKENDAALAKKIAKYLDIKAYYPVCKAIQSTREQPLYLQSNQLDFRNMIDTLVQETILTDHNAVAKKASWFARLLGRGN